MATRTGRLVVDMKTGKVVDELKEDQMMVALYDDAVCSSGNVETLPFQRVLRSDFTVKKINALFNCNAALLKDPFGNVLWPTDWLTRVLPPTRTEKWYYVIHERLEPAPQDDLADPFYAGETVVVLAHVPLACAAIDVRTWLLVGIAADYAPLQRLCAAVDALQLKQRTAAHKLAALPPIDTDDDDAPQQQQQQQQAALRQTLAAAVAGQTARFDAQLTELLAKCKRIERLVLTEPLELAPLDNDSVAPTAAAAAAAAMTTDEHTPDDIVETRAWSVAFTSPRGAALATIAMHKCDWPYVRLVPTRPTPRAFVEATERGNDSNDDDATEINMRGVRLRRLKHGDGAFMVQAALAADEPPNEPALPPWHDDFHIASIGAMYAGEWRLGKRHGRGVEYTNAGVYDGAFAADVRCGSGKFVLGDGTSVVGAFAQPSQQYEYAPKRSGQRIAPSLLNGDAFRDGVAHSEHMRVTFPDGAHYEGEMRDGVVTGYGRYTSSTGVVDDGTFLDGLLHGDHCVRTFPDGTRHEGSFVQGELHGRAQQHLRHGDAFDGYFDTGTRHGRAVSLFAKKQAKHTGYWHEGVLNGRGDVLYCEASSSASALPSTTTAALSVATDAILKSDDNVEAHRSSDDRDNASVDATKNGTDVNATAIDVVSTASPYDYWYEGSFVQGESVARHRNVALRRTSQRQHHLPFTTNGKSSERMPFVTDVLPTYVHKQQARAATNTKRRQQRESAFLKQRTHAHLSLYYSMLDAFYEQWASDRKDAKSDAELPPAERAHVEAERAAMRAFEAGRLQFRKERYCLSPPTLELRRFEECLERISLTEHVALERAVANEWSDASTSSHRQHKT